MKHHNISAQQFPKIILFWFDQHGRKNLPWQKNIDAYRVWVSEIMLQQTQVTTAIPYFERFVERFPNMQSLASAELDEVFHYWSGLGYYSRAKNLHQTAQIVNHQFAGNLPDDLDSLITLPGIGRSTAGAIIAIAYKKHAAILDGNVKRVLTRYTATEGWPGKTEVLKQLWQVAETFTPKQRIDDYTQAMMDLGATVCTRSKPRCQECPLHKSCLAYTSDRIVEFPAKKPKKSLAVKNTRMLVVSFKDNFLLQKRPLTGIWPGLWSFFELPIDANITLFCQQQFPSTALTLHDIQGFRHTFSHYHLDIHITRIQLLKKPKQVMEDQQQLWYNIHKPQAIGLAAPVSKILNMASTITPEY